MLVALQTAEFLVFVDDCFSSGTEDHSSLRTANLSQSPQVHPQVHNVQHEF